MSRCLRLCLFALPLLSLLFCVEASAQQDKADNEVVYLRLETFPYKYRDGWNQSYRLMREMPRQACFIALHEEMGRTVRDEVLGETLPEGAKVVHLALLDRVFHDKKTWEIRIYLLDPNDSEKTIQDLWPTEALWKKSIPWSDRLNFAHGEMAPQLEELSRGELVEALKAVGIEARDDKPAATDTEFDLKAIEAMLLEMDFVKQFDAVRQTHQAIDHEGESPELLGYLVRGYTNLALLTEHHWNAASDGYGARAMIYAERLAAIGNEDANSLWHRAYMWTLIGNHNHALDDLAKLAEKGAQTSGPEWTKVIEPTCYCDRKALSELATNSESIAALAYRMHMQLSWISRYYNWIYHSGMDMARNAPTSYDAYAYMARYGMQLSVKRAGASYGPMALERFLPESLDSLTDLPDEVRALLPTTAAKATMLQFTLRDPEPMDPFSPVPPAVAAKLRKYSKQEPTGALSWSALGYLLEEEVFVEVANYLEVSTDGTERSMASDVAGVWPFVRNHRYAKYIESYKINRRRNPDDYAALFKDFEIRDPTPILAPVTYNLTKIKNDDGVDIGKTAWEYAFGDRTISGSISAAFPYGPDSSGKGAKWAKYHADIIKEISPHCEVWIRLAIESEENPSYEQLQQWESELNSDPQAYEGLGVKYLAMDKTDDAIRCFEKSLSELMTKDASIRLAMIYSRRGDYDEWEETLNRALEQMEDLGLQHAFLHREFTWGYAHRGLWKEAKKHALIEANTWSAWGMLDASIVTEALAQWEESEAWVREASESYRTGSGYEWYYWCRRTGRGDLEGARELARVYFEHPNYSTSRDACVSRGVYYLLEGRHREALESYKKALAAYPSFTCTMMVAQLSRQLGDKDTAQQVIEAMEKHVAEMDPSERDEVEDVGLLLLAALKKESISDEELEQLESGLIKNKPSTRCAFAYFLARQLEVNSQKRAADEYYRKALTMTAGEPNYYTLSGARLAEQRGTSRPTRDVLDEDNLWPQPDDE